MIVYEFFLRGVFKAQVFEVLCESFYGLGNVLRQVDNSESSCVYAVSRNPETSWVQLLVDDNTPEGIITAIEAKIAGLSDGEFAKYASLEDNIAPMERPRKEIGI